VIEDLQDTPAESSGPAVSPGCVLVVDDDYGLRETTVEILAAADIEAEAAGSAAAALDRVGTLQPALALVDHRLPDATGIELARGLKERDPDLGVLIVTGYASLENAIAAVGHVDGYLTKPVPPIELLRVVRGGLDAARLRRENRELLEKLRRTNLLLEESVAGRTRELSDLLAMAEALAATTDLDDVVDSCLRSASEVTGARYAGLYLNEGAAGEQPDLRLRASTGVSLLPGRLERSSPTAIDDVIVDLTVGGHEVGVIVLGGATRRNPMFLATFAGAAAIAIQNAQRLGREREAVERLSELSRMKSTFLAAVSHELRTPLTAVIGFSDMLRNGLGTASQERQLEMTTHILAQGRRLGELIDDLLDASRVEFGGLRVQLGDVDVGAVVTRHADSLGRSPCPLVLRIADALPPAVADEARLEQVVANLVGNAIRHSPAGSPVEVRADAIDGHVRLVVADHGSGIPPELLPHLFEPFTRGKASAGGRSDGLGLGLYISRGLVEAMDGTIAVHSRPGEGSEFCVRLRLAGQPR
jgi:signal transduction histidine kinase/FixJ family two-component response regulator